MTLFVTLILGADDLKLDGKFGKTISPNSFTLTFSPFSLKMILPVQLC